MVLLRAVALIAAATLATAQVDGLTKCSPSQKCPQDSPCCSSYGNCGTGAYCLGGCDPKSSFNLQSCMPVPVCKAGDYKMTTMDDVAPNTRYLGDSSKANWVSSGTPAVYNNEAMLLTMPPDTVGTLLSSTSYMWYGKVGATITTSQGKGVVTAFILMSDVKDEIDYEWVGADVQTAQSNYYYQGITNYGNSKNLSVSNTAQNSHYYEIDWTPDTVTWSIDGQALRTLKKSDTYNDTDKTFHYPQTPSRVQFSLWPAGLSKNGQGTIDWAGGLVDWNSPYMQNGYYYAKVSGVKMQCYDPPANAQKAGTKAYTYTSTDGTEGTVKIGDDNTILASFQANGNNQQLGAPAKTTGTASGTSSAAAQSSTAAVNQNTIPGVAGVGSYGNSATSNTNNADANSGSSSSSGSTGSTGSTGSSGSFSQGGATTGGKGTNDARRLLVSSVVVLVAVFAAAMML